MVETTMKVTEYYFPSTKSYLFLILSKEQAFNCHKTNSTERSILECSFRHNYLSNYLKKLILFVSDFTFLLKKGFQPFVIFYVLRDMGVKQYSYYAVLLAREFFVLCVSYVNLSSDCINRGARVIESK